MRKYSGILLGGAMLAVLIGLTAAASLITTRSPVDFFPEARLHGPMPGFIFGGDGLGRDLFARTLFGGRISILVGLTVATLTTIAGLTIGVLAGYFKSFDLIVMRIMDGLMAIPHVLLAIALMIVAGSSLRNVIIAISLPVVPRVVRLVRSLVLSIRELPYVEAAVVTGTPTYKIVIKHILPNTLAPLAVQATFNCGTAIITESYLSFLGAGIPPEIPSWGNIMAEGRVHFMYAPWIIIIPGIFAGITVLSINILGDSLRDLVDPKGRKRLTH